VAVSYPEQQCNLMAPSSPRRYISVPIVRVERVNVYALLDADSDEARTFTTYLNYWDSLAELMER